MRLASVTPKPPPSDPGEYDVYSFGLDALWRSIIYRGGTIHEPSLYNWDRKWRVTWPDKEEVK